MVNQKLVKVMEDNTVVVENKAGKRYYATISHTYNGLDKVLEKERLKQNLEDKYIEYEWCTIEFGYNNTPFLMQTQNYDIYRVDCIHCGEIFEAKDFNEMICLDCQKLEVKEPVGDY